MHENGLESVGADDLLREVATTYSSMLSYRDTGVVRDRDRGELNFETRFLGPALFRFLSLKPHPYSPLAHLVTRSACGFDGESYYLAMSMPNLPPKHTVLDNIQLAVAGAVPLSGGASHTIAKLLFPQVGGFGVLNIGRALIVRTDIFEESACFVVEGSHSDGSAVSIWIDKSSRTVRRVWTSILGYKREEIRRDVIVNGPMDPSEFESD